MKMKCIKLLSFVHSLFAALLFNYAEALPAENLVGGKEAEYNQFKYQVSLQQTLGFNLCGGGIIGNSHVLTAAHCILNQHGSFSKDPLFVLAGVTDSSDAFGVVREVEKIYVLKGFTARSALNGSRPIDDIAVLKLKKKLHLRGNPSLEKLRLPESSAENYANATTVIAGFGSNSVKLVKDPSTGKYMRADSSSNYTLRFNEAYVLKNEVCQLIKSREIHRSNLCAISRQSGGSGDGVCGGDSGGPLVFRGTVIGVVSNGPRNCIEKTNPTIYTRVSYYKSFIENALDDNVTEDMRYAIVANKSVLEIY